MAAAETEIESALIDWLNAHHALAIHAVPVAAFAEACLGIGLFFRFILVATCSYLYTATRRRSRRWRSFFAGALVGDYSGFYVGRWIGPRLHHSAFGRRHATRIAKADALVLRWGWGAIMIGRFLPAIRSIIPAMTGVAGCGRVHYTLSDTLACLL